MDLAEGDDMSNMNIAKWMATVFLLSSSNVYSAEECAREYNSYVWACEFKVLSWVQVSIQTELTDLENRKKEFERDIRAYLRRDIPTVEHEVLSYIDAIGKYGFDSPDINERAGYSCFVWTVGNDYPVAYHVECEVHSYGSGRSHWKSNTQNAVLGYDSSENVPQTIDQKLEDFIEDLASLYYDARLQTKE